MAADRKSYAVIGGASGAGLAVAQRLLAHGSRPIVIDRTPPPASSAPHDAPFYPTDPADDAETDALVRRMRAEHPRLAGVIVDAEAVPVCSFEDLPARVWSLLLHRHVAATVALVHGLLPALQAGAVESGAADIIVLETVAVERPASGTAVQAAATAAMGAFAARLGVELEPRGIRVARLVVGRARDEQDPAVLADCAAVVEFILQQPAGVVVDDLTLVSALRAPTGPAADER